MEILIIQSSNILFGNDVNQIFICFKVNIICKIIYINAIYFVKNQNINLNL